MARTRSARRAATCPASVAAAFGLLLVLGATLESAALPIVDPGLFVILGVRTCGGGDGYCLLGTDCTLDRDFAADDAGGHCDGLRAAFTPAAHFSCCKYVERSNATLPGEPADATTTEDPGQYTTVAEDGDAENVIETEVRVNGPEQQQHQDAVKEAATSPASAATPPPLPSPPPGPASGQTVTAVSDVYKVHGVPEVVEEAEVVAVAAPTKEAVVESPACRSPTADVNPCWRSSFQDRHGATLCSGTLVGVDAAVTTAVCASRLMEAGLAGLALRVDGLTLPVREMTVHQDYLGEPDDPNDIAVVRVLLAGGLPGQPPAPAPSPSCVACLPPRSSAGPSDRLAGKTCFALAARLNGQGVETSGVCAGRVADGAHAADGVHVKLSGCEVATLKAAATSGEAQQAQAVRAREGAPLLCEGALVGLASTPTGSFSSLTGHLQWLSRTLAAPRTSIFHH